MYLLNERKVYKGFDYNVCMDDVDRSIVNVLEENARLSFRKIAEMVGTTAATVSARIAEMERKGIIKKYTVLVDHEQLGMITLLLMINADVGRMRDVLERMVQLNGVSCVLRVTGDYDVVALVRCSGHKGARDLLDFIKGIDGVRSVTSQVVLETVKESLCVKV